MTKRLTVLFNSVDGVGHVNSCIGLAEVLQSRGHKIVFVVGKGYEGKLTHYGFIEEIIKVEGEGKPGEAGASHLLEDGMLSEATSLEKMKKLQNNDFFSTMIDKVLAAEPQMKEIVAKHKPDVIVIDHFIGSPTLVYSGKPWVFLFSGNPLIVLEDERTPPAASGFPSNGDKTSKEWKEFRELSDNMFTEYSIKYNNWLKENGYPTTNNKKCIPESPYLNVYGYPEELDYTDIRPLPDKWFRIDAFMRKGEQEFDFPDKLKGRDEKTQKLIYLSLGSMGSINIQLMKRLVDILSKSPHKYIVSKGLLGDKYELPDNMWGQNSVPQTRVLPLVDLVITHGGNNTVTETFSFGKPQIVMPLFGDQFDNAQRIHEKGYGVRLEPHSCTEQELLGAIDKLLNDNDMKKRLTAASKRMLSSDSLIRASKIIENLK